MDSRTRISPSELGIQILQNCMVELLSLFPQLDTACAALGCFPDPDGSGIGTDGRIIRFSPPELLRRYQDSPAAVRRGYLHMLLHCLYLHPFSDRTGCLWDLAADMAVENAYAWLKAVWLGDCWRCAAQGSAGTVESACGDPDGRENLQELKS